MVGSPRTRRPGARTSGSSAAGHAAVEPEVVRELYAVAADDWVDAGLTNHHVLVPATDSGARRRMVPARVRAAAPARGPRAAGSEFAVIPRSELVVRLAEREDIPALAELEMVLPRHSQASPIFSQPPIQSLERRRRSSRRTGATRSGRSSWPSTRAGSSARRSAAPSRSRRATRHDAAGPAPASSASRPCSRTPAASARGARSARRCSPGRATPATTGRRRTGARPTSRRRAPGRPSASGPTFRRLHRRIG